MKNTLTQECPMDLRLQWSAAPHNTSKSGEVEVIHDLSQEQSKIDGIRA